MAITESELRDKINAGIQAIGQPMLWGVCDFDPALPIEDQYEKIIVLVVPTPKIIKPQEYVEPIFRHQQKTVYMNIMRFAGDVLFPIFKQAGIRFALPPHSTPEEFEREMTEVMSAKEAARRAGIGWIGKSNLLVTPEFGPQINIGTILADAPLTAGTPITESRCGNCHNCVDSCPAKAIHGVLWEPSIPRNQQIDYAKCSQWRLETYEHLGRKITCGKCLFVCPYGWKRNFPSDDSAIKNQAQMIAL
jgi:ferredoxin